MLTEMRRGNERIIEDRRVCTYVAASEPITVPSFLRFQLIALDTATVTIYTHPPHKIPRNKLIDGRIKERPQDSSRPPLSSPPSHPRLCQ